MIIHLFSSKTNYTNKFYIPKMRENSPFQVLNVSHTHITDDQPTFTIMEMKENQWSTMHWWKRWSSIYFHSKQITPINFPYSNWGKTDSFIFLNVSHTHITDDQPTFTIMEIKENQWSTMHWWKKMIIYLFPFKTNYTNKFSILKLRENSQFHIFNISHTHITDDQTTSTIMKNKGKSNDEQSVYGKRWPYIYFHPKQIIPVNSPYQNWGKTVHFKFFNLSHTHITDDQPTFTIMEN